MNKLQSIRDSMVKTSKASNILLVVVLVSVSFSALHNIFPSIQWITWMDILMDIAEWIAVTHFLVKFFNQVQVTSVLAAAVQEIIEEEDDE